MGLSRRGNGVSPSDAAPRRRAVARKGTSSGLAPKTEYLLSSNVVGAIIPDSQLGVVHCEAGAIRRGEAPVSLM